MACNRSILSFLSLLSLLSLGLCQDLQQKSKALLEAVQKGDVQQVLALLDSGVDVNARGELNYTPLIMAAKYSQIEIAEILCDRGADVNAVSSIAELYGEPGFSPLLWAAWNCHLDMADLLIRKGANIEHLEGEGDTPLMIAARRGCLPLVGRFIEKEAAIDEMHNYDLATALMEAIGQGHLDVAIYLIEHRASLDTKNSSGMSLLSMAANAGRFAAVRYFVEKGLSVNGRDDHGKTPISYALGVAFERRYILQYLIEHGGDPTIKSKLGVSPLMKASLNGLFWQVGFLIDKGAVVNDADLNNETPLHYACRGIRDQLFYRLWNVDSEATIRLLLEKGARVNILDGNGRTPLMNAARNDAPRVIETLLKHGALVNLKDKEGWTALMYAAEWNQTSVIKVLVQRGADLNLKNSKGETALALAKQKKSSVQAYELLRSLGVRD